MYIILAAGIIASCATTVSTEASDEDDLNLLQAKLIQQRVVTHHILGRQAAKSGKEGKEGKEGEEDEDGCSGKAGKSGKYGKVGKEGKHGYGKGKTGMECESAEQFCTVTIEHIQDCQDDWKKHGNCPLYDAICTVTREMVAHEENNEDVIKIPRKDAKVLRNACKKFVLGRKWREDEDDDGQYCPTDFAQVEQACAAPAEPSNFKKLKMATFCDELEFMCDNWALWFTIAAEKQSNGDSGDGGYSCTHFAAMNAHVWNDLAPGGCGSGESFEDLNDPGTVTTRKNRKKSKRRRNRKQRKGRRRRRRKGRKGKPAVVEEEDEDANTVEWEPISSEFGCYENGDPEAIKPRLVANTANGNPAYFSPVVEEQDCFNECQQNGECRAVDIDKEENACYLFNRPCKQPTRVGKGGKQGKDGDDSDESSIMSWRLINREIDCSMSYGFTQPNSAIYDLQPGHGKKFECPRHGNGGPLYEEFNSKKEGCLLPEGILAACVCSSEESCIGIETKYDPEFRQENPMRVKLTTRSWVSEDECLSLSWTCVKPEGLLGLLEEGMQARAEANHKTIVHKSHAEPGIKHAGEHLSLLETDMDAALEITTSRKGCLDTC